jgi:hypothetical protein
MLDEGAVTDNELPEQKAIRAALAEIDRLHAIRADVERLPRYAVHGDRPGTMIEWPHGEFLARDAVLAALETP